LNLLIVYYYWEYFLIMNSEIFFNVPLRLKILLLFGTFNLIGVSYLVFYLSIISFNFFLKYYDYFVHLLFYVGFICVSEVLGGLCLFFYSGSFLILYIFYELAVLAILFCLLGYGRQLIFLLSLCFLVKFPVYFLHVWLPKVHVEAPTNTRIVLAGVILKIVFCSFNCMFQSDCKSLAAYSSICHMGFVLLSEISILYYVGNKVSYICDSRAIICLPLVFIQRINNIVNHKTIGTYYIILAGLGGSLLSMINPSPGGYLFFGNGQVYNSVLTIHGTLMIFFMVIPILIVVLMAFPRVNALSFRFTFVALL
uniref:Cytochrome c oxidase subunit 1 n=1 Tax=Brugia timori TaxID=42155 RepID=A0A0R3R9F7_9BILA